MKIKFSTQFVWAGVIALFMASMVSSARATLIAYDPMCYSGSQINTTTASPSGTPTQTTGGGFAGDWGGGALTWNSTGLTYANLPTTCGSISSLGANDLYEKIASAPTNTTVWVSFLFNQSGDNGGNRSGVILENSSGTGIMFSYQQYSGSQGYPCLMKMSGTTAVGTQLTPDSSTLRTYTANNLYVLKFTYTSGVVSSIAVYSNPTAGQTVAPSADFTVSSGLPSLGAVVNFGLVDGSAEGITLDEFRVGTTFADVVGTTAVPAVPTGVSATAGNTQVVLNWTASSGATSYNILSGTSTGNYTVTNTAASNSYTNMGLTDGTTYYYVIEAVNSGGTSANSSEVNATPMPLPTTPTGLTATPGVNSVSLIWNPASNATGYNVLRGTSTGNYTVTNSAASATNFDATAVGGTTYYYVVEATNAVGVSALSSEVSVTPTSGAPTPPSGLSATPTNGQVMLSWTAGTGAISYNVKRSTTSGAEVTISPAGTVTGTTYTDSTAVNGTIYYYVVSSTNTVSESANSSEVTATMPPGTPTALNATAGANQVGLTWTAPSGLTPSSYNVKRSTNSGSGYITISTSGSVTTTGYTDSTALSGTTYYYVVSAVDTTGEGPNSTQASATPTGAPQAPTGVTATAGYTSISVSWTAALGSPTSYNVKRSTTSGAETTITPAGTLTGTNYTDSTVTVGTQYFYEVSATNTYGESANSSEVSATASGTPSAYEPFNYPLGALASGTASTGTGFTGTWTCAPSGTIVAGLTYPGLSYTNNALSSGSGRQFESFANPFGSGTVFMSFLVSGSGDPGGNVNGVYLIGNNATSLFAGFYSPFSSSQTGWGLGSVTTAGSTPTGMSTTFGTIRDINNSTVHLIVLEIQFNTSGNNSTITEWIDPTAGSASPPTASATGSFNVGTISGIGLNGQGGTTMTFDEVRVGVTYGSVVNNNPVPMAPSGLTATPETNSVDLIWNAVSGATGYNVLRGTSSGIYTQTNAVASATNFDNTTAGGTTYYYVVEATNSVGIGPNSLEVSVTPYAAIPAVPAGVSAAPGNSQVTLSWLPSMGAASYNVKRSTTSGAETNLSAAGSVTGTNYIDTTAVNGTTYYYEISATNAAGESANSAEVSATPNLPPVAPTGLTAVAGTNSVGLSWNPSSGAIGYNVKRSTTSGAETTLPSGANVSGTNFTDSTAISGTTYYYEVSAINAYGEGANSTEASATPTGVPQAPTGLQASASFTVIDLSWNAALGNPTGYNVKRSTTSGAETTLPLGTNVSSLTFTDATVVVGTKYYYEVSAVNTYGESANSAETNATAPGAPSAYEPFNYPIGAATLANGTATTATGFTGNWTCAPAGAIVAGLSYPNLPVAYNALSSGSGRQFESFANPFGSGTVYMSFLVSASGDPGGNVNGVYLIGNNTTSLFAGFYSPFSAAYTGWGLGSVTSAGTSATGMSTTFGTVDDIGNATVHLVVLEIQFKTSGNNSTVTEWIDPTAGVSTPPTPNATASFNVGTISGIGLNCQGGTTMTLDEISLGASYASVVGITAPPAVPTGLTATPGVNSVSLNWNAVAGASGYNILRGTASGVYTVTNSVVSNSDIDNLVVGGTTYYYVVQATNSLGSSTNSLEVSVTPTIAPPGIPTGLAAVAGNDQVSLSWNAASGAASYNVKRSTTSGAEVTVSPAGTVTGTSYVDNTAVNGTTYYYEVSATNAAAESANSGEVSVTPNPPYTGYTITDSGNGNATAGSSDTLTIMAVTAGGPVTGMSGSITLTFSGLANSPNGTTPTVNGTSISTSIPVTFTGGAATVTLIPYDAQTASLAVTDGTHTSGSAGGAALNLTVSPAVPSAYRIGATNTTPAAGVASTLMIGVVDAYQNQTAFTGGKTITFGGLSAAPNGALPTVNGTPFGTGTAVSFTGGTASVSLITVKAENGVTLSATDGTLSTTATGGAAPTLSPASGPAASLGISTQPGTTSTAGSALSPQPVVTVLDHYGNSVASSSASINVSAATGGITGTFPLNTVNGVATFTDLALTGAGTNTLTFSSSGIVPTNSVQITISAGPFVSLGWVTQPGSAVYSTVFGIQPVLATVDAFGNPSTNGLGTNLPVTIALTSGVGTLSGTTNFNLGTMASNGVVRFSDLSINTVGTNYILTASTPVSGSGSPPAGMAVWLDSSVASSVLTSAGNVVQWNDLSGNNYNFNLTEGSGTITYGTTNMNGKPVVSFPGSSAPAAALLTTNNVYTFNGTSMTLFTVVRTTSTFPDYTGPFDSAGAGGADGSSTTWGMNSMYPYNDRFTVQGTTVTGTPTLPTGTPFIWEGADNGPANQEWVGYDDGTTSNLVSNTTGTQSAFAITQLAVGSTLGGVNSLSQQWNGDVAEVLLYNSYLTPSQQAQIYSYLQSKWLGGVGSGGGTPLTASTAPFTVAPAPLTITGGITANSKAYDGTTNDTLTIGTVTFSGVLAQDTGNVGVNTSGAVGSFANAGPGNSIPVTVTGITTTGSAAGNYAVAPLVLSANITQAGGSEPVHVGVSGGVVKLTFNGSSGSQYILQRSTNLSIGSGWISISTNNASSNTVFNVTDTFPDIGFAPKSAYYRLFIP